MISAVLQRGILRCLRTLPRRLRTEQLFQFFKKYPDFGYADPVWRIAGIEITAQAAEWFEIVENGAQFPARQGRAAQVGWQHADAMSGQYRAHDAIDVVEEKLAGDRHADFFALPVNQSPYPAFVKLQ